ncbi:MAG: sugar-transfer associated ATP-grasp domain-containing protein [Salibacteraceae bacterium]
MKRFLYLGYYFKQADWSKLWRFASYEAKINNLNPVWLLLNAILNSVSYNISLLEYFQFHFSNKDDEEKKRWAGTGFMYEYQLKMNPPKSRLILDDKRLFAQEYSDFLIHQVFTLDEIKRDKKLLSKLKEGSHNKIVLKYLDGKCGIGVEILNASEYTDEELITYMQRNNYDLIEAFITQHDDLNRLSPSAVNTVRIITQLNDQGGVDILGCRQRISVNSNVDNMAAGNLAAGIDEKTGQINTLGYYSDITKSPESVHPITKVELMGFQVPKWDECLQLAKNAALHNTSNKSIGWDIVVTNNKVGLIEGNHDWCKLVWQIPVQKGLKSKLKPFIA